MSVPTMMLPPGQKLWQIVYSHPGRSPGETRFQVLCPIAPDQTMLTAYVCNDLGEEFDAAHDSFDVAQIYPESIRTLFPEHMP
jgi:hypothetical protein